MQSLTVKDLTKSYHGKAAVEKVSFSVHSGQVVGLLGPNGAGKTTTMSMITGVLAPDSGEILFDGQALTPESEFGIKKRIGYLSESNPLYPDMLVREYLEYAAGLRGMSKDERREAISRVVKETEIEDRLNQPIEELSKGYRQRVGLAQAILHQPELLILDEPTEGLDPNQRLSIRDLISKLGEERTVLISTHVLSEVQAMCDSVLILNEGKLITQGTVDQVIQQAKGAQTIEFEATGHDIAGKLQQGGFHIVVSGSIDGHERFVLTSAQEQDARPKLFALAKEQGWNVYELHQIAQSLEDTFRQLTSKEGTTS